MKKGVVVSLTDRNKTASNETIKLSSAQDLRLFAAKIHPFALRLPKHVELLIPNLSISKQQTWKAIIERYLRACGCPTGAVCTLLALAYCILAQFTNVAGNMGSLGWRSIPISFGIVISAGFLGKMGSLFLSRLLLKHEINQMVIFIEKKDNLV